MKSLLSCLALAVCLLPFASGQTQILTPNGSRSDAITLKIKQLDVLIQVLPLAIRKEQYGPLLSALEHARAKQKEIEQLEDADLAKIDSEVSTALNDAIMKGTYPPKAVQEHAAKLYHAMSVREQISVSEIMDDMMKAVNTIFDEGQKKVMANSLDPYAMDPSIKKDSLTTEGKVRFFVARIFMDPVTYDLMVKLETKSAG